MDSERLKQKMTLKEFCEEEGLDFEKLNAEPWHVTENTKMTRYQFLENCDFNNISLIEKVDRVIEMIDGNYCTLADGDSKHWTKLDGKFIPDEEFLKSNTKMLDSFPMLEIILREFKAISKYARDKEALIEKLKPFFTQESREVKLNELL